MQNDGQLLREFAANGGDAAFAELVRRHSPMVLAVCRRMLDSRQDAEDASQAVFLALAKTAKSLSGDGSVAGWLYRVAICTAQNAYKARARRQAREEQAAMIMSEYPAGSGSDPEQLSALREALAGLPEKYRLPIVLHHLEGKSYEAAAELAGCKPKAFSVRLARGREMLRTRLARRGVACALPMLVGWLAEEAVAEEVSETFIVATAKMACGWAGAGGTMAAGAEVVPTHVAELAKGVLNMMRWTQIKFVAAVSGIVCLGVAAVVTAASLTAGTSSAGSPETTTPAKPTVAAKKADPKYAVYIYPREFVEAASLLKTHTPFQTRIKFTNTNVLDMAGDEVLKIVSRQSGIPFVWSPAPGAESVADYLRNKRIKIELRAEGTAEAWMLRVLDTNLQVLAFDIGVSGGAPTLPPPTAAEMENPETALRARPIEIADKRTWDVRYEPLRRNYGTWQKTHGKQTMLFTMAQRIEQVSGLPLLWAEGVNKDEVLAREFVQIPGVPPTQDCPVGVVLRETLATVGLKFRVMPDYGNVGNQ